MLVSPATLGPGWQNWFKTDHPGFWEVLCIPKILQVLETEPCSLCPSMHTSVFPSTRRLLKLTVRETFGRWRFTRGPVSPDLASLKPLAGHFTDGVLGVLHKDQFRG